MAYCLIGILGIHMPLLYGEGHNAFLRLQDEIIKYTYDMSVFEWKSVSATHAHAGASAPSPTHFACCKLLETLNRYIFFNTETIQLASLARSAYTCLERR